MSVSIDEPLYTFSEVARRLDVQNHTVSDLVRRLGIKAIKHPMSGNAKAITADGLKRITEALTGPAS